MPIRNKLCNTVVLKFKFFIAMPTHCRPDNLYIFFVDAFLIFFEIFSKQRQKGFPLHLPAWLASRELDQRRRDVLANY